MSATIHIGRSDKDALIELTAIRDLLMRCASFVS